MVTSTTTLKKIQPSAQGLGQLAKFGLICVAKLTNSRDKIRKKKESQWLLGVAEKLFTSLDIAHALTVGANVSFALNLVDTLVYILLFK